MKQPDPHVSIIVLNWNGWSDTIECLESVLHMTYDNFSIILIDNHSTDESVQEIRDWAAGISKKTITTKYPDLVSQSVNKSVPFLEIDGKSAPHVQKFSKKNKTIVFVRNSENVGFAVANNQGMRLAESLFGSEYYYLLNNDTVVEKETLIELVRLLTNNKKIGMAQSVIYEYGEKNKIANAGGRILFWGQTKYFKKVSANEYRRISFINGCALFTRAELIRNIGYLSEKFFFGEEDFELSMRLRKRNITAVCAVNSIIYHKIGRSSQKLLKDYERHVFLFALNRSVDLKDFFPLFIWYIWKIPSLSYFGYLLFLRYRVPFKRTIYLVKNIYHFSSRIRDVKKNTVDNIFKAINLW